MIHQYTRRRLLAGAGATLAAGAAGCLGSGDDTGGSGGGADLDASVDWTPSAPLAVDDARLYSGPGCSCCGQYAAYLDEHLDADLEERVAEDVAETKREHGVPSDLASCHTVDLDGYVVEGHVPVAAVATLLEERPAIDGIALPGMPAGSPGMGGQLDPPLEVRALGGGRTGEVFARLG